MGSGASCQRITPKIRYSMGVDEAGRGPLFGPVYAAAVVLEDGTGVFRDSKTYSSAKALQSARELVEKHALVVGVGSASAKEIDDMNIRKATHLAMHRAITSAMGSDARLNMENTHLLVDGNDFTPYTQPGEECIVCAEHTCVVKGDAKVPAISAASIVAKVTRDNEIARLCDEDNRLDTIYGIRKNKGYGTAQHMQAIKEHGITVQHRKTFRPCAQCTNKEKEN